MTAPGYNPQTAGFGPSSSSGQSASGYRNYPASQPAYNARPASPAVSSFQSASTYRAPQVGGPSSSSFQSASTFGGPQSFGSSKTFGSGSPGQTQGFNSIQRIPGGISVQSGQSSFSTNRQPAFGSQSAYAGYGSANAPKSTYLPPP